MANENILQAIVTAEVNRRYATQKDFYNGVLKITQQSWNRWKNGESRFTNDNILLIKTMFTRYEWMLIDNIVSQDNVYSKEFDSTNPYDVYQSIKLDIAKRWVDNNASVTLNRDSRTYKGEKTTKIHVYYLYDTGFILNDDTLTISVDSATQDIPATTKDKAEWFNKNIDNVII